VYQESTNSEVYVPDKTNNAYSKNCETDIDHTYHPVRRLAALTLLTAGPATNEVDAAATLPSFDCSPFSDSESFQGATTPPQFLPFEGDPYAVRTIPYVPYARFASGRATYTLSCAVFYAGPSPASPEVVQDKAARTLAIHVRFFPESELGSYEIKVKHGDETLLGVGGETPGEGLVYNAAENPTTPFHEPPKNGCREGSGGRPGHEW